MSDEVMLGALRMDRPAGAENPKKRLPFSRISNPRGGSNRVVFNPAPCLYEDFGGFEESANTVGRLKGVTAMARITVEDCLERVSSRFELVQLATTRAKQLLKGARPLVSSDNREVVIALREIAAGKVRAAPKL